MFCYACAQSAGLAAHVPGTNRPHCPACERPLQVPGDMVHWDATAYRDPDVLVGLQPTEALEYAFRAVRFWEAQAREEMSVCLGLMWKSSFLTATDFPRILQQFMTAAYQKREEEVMRQSMAGERRLQEQVDFYRRENAGMPLFSHLLGHGTKFGIALKKMVQGGQPTGKWATASRA